MGKLMWCWQTQGITEMQNSFSNVLKPDGISLAKPDLPVLDVCLKGLVYSEWLVLSGFVVSSTFLLLINSVQ